MTYAQGNKKKTFRLHLHEKNVEDYFLNNFTYWHQNIVYQLLASFIKTRKIHKNKIVKKKCDYCRNTRIHGSSEKNTRGCS